MIAPIVAVLVALAVGAPAPVAEETAISRSLPLRPRESGGEGQGEGQIHAAGEPGRIRVEPRLLTKAHRFVMTAGPVYISRGDYHVSPGFGVMGSYYPSERGGVELRMMRFFSRLSASAREVEAETGLVPDAQRPESLLSAGWRHTLGYGKVLPFRALGVVHFDVQGTALVGLLATDRQATAALGLGPGLLVRLGNRAVAQLDVVLLASFEDRVHASTTRGLLTTLSFGARL